MQNTLNSDPKIHRKMRLSIYGCGRGLTKLQIV